MLHGSLDFNPVVPTSNPNFILVGILLFLKFAITCAAKFLFLKESKFVINLFKFIFSNFLSVVFIVRKFELS